MKIVLVAVMTALALAAPAAAQVPVRASEGFELVAQIPGTEGTDLEFFSRELTSYRDADGATVTPPAPVVRHFAVVGNQANDPQIVDITDPEAPYTVARIACTMGQGDVQVNEERSIIVLANGGSGPASRCRYLDADSGQMRPTPPGSAIVDMSDLYAPKVVGAAPAADGSHNQTLHPGGRYLYISTSPIIETGAAIPVYDLADPRRPKLVTTFTPPGNSPHDIRFNATGTRAYMAGVSQFRIVDTTNPEAPRLISTFMPPGATIGHDVVVSPDGAFLFAGDEGGGGLTYPCPGGAVHTYDIRNEAVPVYLGQTFAGTGPVTNRDGEITTEVGEVGACTSHVMELNPDGRSITLGWYTAGTRVFSFAGLYDAAGKPRTFPAAGYGHDAVGLVETGWIVPDGANTWSAKQYAPLPGYIFSDDLELGFYVTRFDQD